MDLDNVLRFLDHSSYQSIQKPLLIQGELISSNLYVNPDDFIITASIGTISFSFFGPWEDADGEGNDTPPHYPAPNLRKNSLVCRIGDIWYQGGVFRGFIAKSSGYVYLRANDSFTADNSDGWQVKLYVIKDINSWMSKGYRNEIFSLVSGELKNQFTRLSNELRRDEENQQLKDYASSFIDDFAKSLAMS
jgi:hypothetical protein